MRSGTTDSTSSGWTDQAGSRTLDEGERSRQLILVIEDDRHDQEIYGRLLWYNGFDVLFAADGEEGVALALERRPDLILLDLALPKLDGVGVCESLRREPSMAKVPIVVLTAHAKERMGERVAAAGCDLFLEKPVSPVAVLHEVEAQIGRPLPPGEDDAPHG